MASAAEQMAANFNIGAFGKATELKQRLWFTLLALIVFRLLTFIPLPGIDTDAFAAIFAKQSQGVLGMLNMFAGGALERMSIIALNIMPYITASIIVQLMTNLSPSLAQLKKEGESGRKKINQYTRYGTVILALVQGYGIAASLWASQGVVFIDSRMLFTGVTMITLLGGTMFVVWLGEQITARGVGNGSSLIIFAGIVASLPTALATMFESARKDVISPLLVIAIIALVVGIIIAIVFMERAQRRILVQYPKRQTAQGFAQGESSHIPLKLNTAGVIPPIFASSLLLLPLSIAQFMGAGATTGGFGEALTWVTTNLGHGKPAYIIAYVLLIVFFCFFYTAIVFNPEETADNLKKHGGFIPGYRPGANTARYLEYVLDRITVIGATYLALLCVIPEILISYASIPFYFGGTSLLIVVNVTMDTVAQIQGHLLAHQYEGLLKKSKLRTSRK
jgi:preprotein translocase subunit SecY